ncbi:hypothetical protein RB195_012863 [Necator americanus]|uniref:Thrombospondin type 1 domain protein n=1 Tax=Necator americanus TaxID=51031 RepID=A0ABR1DUC8_NECAM
MVRMLVPFLFIPRLQCYRNHTSDVLRCWSAWSPCTVTCVPHTSEAIEADFARRWRVWLPKKCPNVPPPDQLTQFRRCSTSVPPCLELESILRPSPRTVYRLVALLMLVLLSVIPSLYICCRYSSAAPVARLEQNEKTLPLSNILDTLRNENVTKKSLTLRNSSLK